MKTSKGRSARLAAAVLVGASLSVGGFYAGTALASGLLAPDPVPGLASTPGGDPAPAAVPSYGVNADGRTYGADIEASTPDQAPDLVLAVATNGRTGYVDRSTLDAATGAHVSSPEEALAWQREMEAATWATKQIPVYLSDGKTKIGVFEVSRSQGSDTK